MTSRSALTSLCLFLALTLATSAQTKKVRIGVLMDNLKFERWQRDSDELQKRARELGAKITVQDAEGSDEAQLTQANQLMEQGIDVLVLVPHDADKAAAVVDAAKKRNIPVICYDRMVRNSSPSLYISFDNVKVGEMQARAMVAATHKSNFLLIGGAPSDNNAKQFREGQMNFLRPLVAKKEISIAGDPWAKTWSRNEAYQLTIQALAKNKDIAAVVASNDETAGGAIKALTEKGLAGKVPVSGQDADLPAIVRIIRGTQTMTVYKPIAPLAKRAIDAAVALARGEKVETNSVVNNGKSSVPAILMQPIAVDKNNLGATVMSDGFHKRDEIKKELTAEEWDHFAKK